jgi:hypothetical protein
MSANVILVIGGIVLILLALGISVWVFVLPMLLRLKASPALRSNVLASIAEKTGWRQVSGPSAWKYVSLFLAAAPNPRFRALALFGRRPPERVAGIVGAGVRKPAQNPPPALQKSLREVDPPARCNPIPMHPRRR